MKLKRKLQVLLLIVLFTVLQSTVLNYIQILQNKPDILLILVIFFSLTFGQIYGLTTGATCGLFSEVSSGIPPGAAIFVYSLGGLILGHIGSLIYRQRIFGQMGITFVFSFATYLTLFLLLQSFNVNLSLFNATVAVILPTSFYTAIVAPFIFRFLKTIL